MLKKLTGWMSGSANTAKAATLEEACRNLSSPFQDKFRDFIISNDIPQEVDSNKDNADYIQEIKETTKTARISLCESYHEHAASAIEDRGISPELFISTGELAKILYDDEYRILNSKPLCDDKSWPKFNSMSASTK